MLPINLTETTFFFFQFAFFFFGNDILLSDLSLVLFCKSKIYYIVLLMPAAYLCATLLTWIQQTPSLLCCALPYGEGTISPSFNKQTQPRRKWICHQLDLRTTSYIPTHLISAKEKHYLLISNINTSTCYRLSIEATTKRA